MRRGSLVALCASAALALTACQPALSLVSAPLPDSSVAEVSLVDLPRDNAPINLPIVVRADNGRLLDVTVSEGQSRTIKGELSPDGRTWTSTRAYLDYDARYTVTATAVDSRGLTTTVEDEFRTVAPDSFITPSFVDTYGTTWGVGMPITVRFDQPVADRAAVEEAMVVHTPTPIEGAWYWTSDSEAIYRPKKYWPGNTDITVDINLKAVEASPGVYGDGRVSQTYRTTDSLVMKASAETLEMDVYENGELVNTIPVTMGKDGYDTLSGTKLIMTKEPERIMDNSTAGVPEDSPEHYRAKVQYAMRLTWHGEFLHASPWAADAWGSYRSSHGCTSMSTENAAWLFERAHIGDPVEITGTPLKQNPGNGITVWNISWDDWVAKSAIGPRMTTPAPAA